MLNTDRLNVLKICVCMVMVLTISLSALVRVSAQGLRFNSNDSLINKRTSYTVFNDAPKFHHILSVSFDLALWDLEHFGYILNITDERHNSYSLTYNHGQNAGTIYFNIDGQRNKLKISIPNATLIKSNWRKLKLQMDLDNDVVTITLNGKNYKAAGFGLRSQIVPKIVFGRNDHYTDVPDMAIRNVSVHDQSSSFLFPLNEWRGSQVHNKDAELLGEVKNPNWLINESYAWEPLREMTFGKPVGLNFDESQHELVIFGKDSLTRYNVVSENFYHSQYSTPMPLNLLLGKSILNVKENSLYAYELSPEIKGKVTLAALNLHDLSWKVIGGARMPEQRHHHNAFFNVNGDSLYVFGGYGGFAYHKEFHTYNKKDDSWFKVRFSGAQISPRFFSAASLPTEKDEVYIFGGYGNESGNQVVGGIHYYDLFRINLKTKKITRCWEIKPTERAFVPANNLILSKDGKYFYALCYPHEDAKTYLRLYRFSIADGKYEVLGGRIPVTSERIESDVNLFLDSISNQFICTIQEFTSPEQSTIRLLSLSNPPISEQMLLQGNRNKMNDKGPYLLLALVAGIVMVSVATVVFKRNPKRSVQKAKEADTAEVPSANCDLRPVPSAPEGILNAERANSIHVLGEFAVYDNSSRNITSLFSPKIQQLFVLILLNSKAGEGVTSKKISSCLWPEKDLAKTKNIKGVTLNHLRSILRDMKGLELTFQNDHYRFVFDEHVTCDLFQVETFLKRPVNASENISDYLPAMLRGSLLPNMQDPWLDDFKNNFDQAVPERLLPEIRKAFDAENYRLTVILARVLFKVDPFNDDAIKIQLNALRRLKGKDAAGKSFQQFKEEYQTSLGVQYPISFEELCP